MGSNTIKIFIDNITSNYIKNDENVVRKTYFSKLKKNLLLFKRSFS